MIIVSNRAPQRLTAHEVLGVLTDVLYLHQIHFRHSIRHTGVLTEPLRTLVHLLDGVIDHAYALFLAAIVAWITFLNVKWLTRLGEQRLIPLINVLPHNIRDREHENLHLKFIEC